MQFQITHNGVYLLAVHKRDGSTQPMHSLLSLFALDLMNLKTNKKSPQSYNKFAHLADPEKPNNL